MALVLADRVQETTATTGTGTWTLAGAVTGYQAFSVVGNANTTYYTATDGGSNWEVGIGTYTLSGTTLARTTVIASSNGGSAVNFPAGPTIFGDAPARIQQGSAFRQIGQFSPSNPTAPNSTSSFTMAGMGGTCALTPKNSGIVEIKFCGTVINSSGTINTGAIWQIAYGTGTAPTSNAAATGTVVGNTQAWKNGVAMTAADINVPFSIMAVASGLTINTAYWFDLQQKSLTTISTGALSTVGATIIEL